MNVEKSFTFAFEDPEWISKLGLGAVISLVPVLNLAWTGYMVEILRNVKSGRPHPLPAWDDLGAKFREGLVLFAAFLVYASPVLLGLCLPLGIAASSNLVSGNGNLDEIGRTLTQAGGAIFLGLLCVLLLYGAFLAVLYPAILVLYSQAGTFASCFHLRQAFALIRKHPGPFFTAWALSLATNLAVGLLVGFVNLVVGFVPCVGWILGVLLSLGSGVYAASVQAHLFGQFGRMALEGEPQRAGA